MTFLNNFQGKWKKSSKQKQKKCLMREHINTHILGKTESCHVLAVPGPIIHSLLHVGLLQNFACQVYWYVAFFLPVFSTFNVNSLCVHAVNGWRHQPGTTKTFIRFLQCFSPRLPSRLHAFVLLCIFLLWFVFFVIYVTNSGLYSAVPLGPQFLHA